MNVMGIDIGHIADLGTQVAQSGAIRAFEIVGDEVFEYLVAMAVLLQDTGPIG